MWSKLCKLLPLLPSILLLITPSVLPVIVVGFSTRSIQHIHVRKFHLANKYRSFAPIATGLDDKNNDQVGDSDARDNFDGKGLANYLGPYALALVASIAVSAAFFKFVLMDY